MDLGIFNYIFIKNGIKNDNITGKLYENYVAFVLKSKGLKLVFSTFGNYEIDFIVMANDLLYGIEVKAGNDSGTSVTSAYQKGLIDKILYLKGNSYDGITKDCITIPIYLFERFELELIPSNILKNLDIF